MFSSAFGSTSVSAFIALSTMFIGLFLQKLLCLKVVWSKHLSTWDFGMLRYVKVAFKIQINF